MRWLLPVLTLLLAAVPTRAEEVDATGRVFVEVVTTRTTRFVGEVTTIAVRLGYDAAWFEAHAVPLFRQEVGVPVHLRLSWLGGRTEAPALRALATAPDEDALAPTVAVNDTLLRMRRLDDEERDGRTYRVLQLIRHYVADAPGELVLDAPRVRFAYATEFEEGFLDERVPVDRQAANAEGMPLALRVVALPDTGRPPAFVDAVGAFRIAARAERTDVKRGEPFRVTLSIQGEGNLADLTPLAKAHFVGFHVYGVIDDKQHPVRSVVYELELLSADVSEVPAIPFAFFDPAPPGRYRVIHTEAMPLTVEGASPPAVAPPGPRALPPASEPSATESEAAPERIPLLAVLLIAALMIGVLATLAWALHLRRRLRLQGDGLSDARVARIRSAREVLDVGLAEPEGDAERSLRAYLAAQLGCAPAALVSPALEARLVAAGIAPELADRVGAYLAEALAARYGAPPEAAPARPDAGLADELQAAFERARG